MKKLASVMIALAIMMAMSQTYAYDVCCESKCGEVMSKVDKGTDKYMTWNLSVPQVKDLESGKIEKKINQQIAGDINLFKKELHTEAKKAYKASKGEKYPYRPYEIQTVYSVHYFDKKIISLTVDKYQYTGGAHGSTVRQPYNYDLCSGKVLGYQDIFKEYPDYKTVIVNTISETIKQNPGDYFDDAIATVQGFSDNQPFYLTNDGIVVYYGQYEIAPYVAGIREFLIPYALFK